MISSSGRRHRTRLVGLVVAALIGILTLAGCAGSDSVDEVTVTVGSTSITLPTALNCSKTPDNSGLLCNDTASDSDAPHLSLAPGTPLDIAVPQAVGDTPWIVLFSYIDGNGNTQGDRTAVFPASTEYSYELHPSDSAQLTRVEVQSLYATPGSDGGVEFPVVQSWVLIVDPIGTQRQ